MPLGYAVDVAASVDVLLLMCKFPSSSYNNIRGEREKKTKKE
jgi:hypothetical protein